MQLLKHQAGQIIESQTCIALRIFFPVGRVLFYPLLYCITFQDTNLLQTHFNISECIKMSTLRNIASIW